jgi:hypothetical protein
MSVRFSMEASVRQRKIGRLLRLGVSGSAGSSSDDAGAVAELETELALLREENAWLKVERHRAPDAGRIVERMRDLSRAPQQADGEGAQPSEHVQMIVECLTIRDGLLEACQEIQQAMQGMRQRLSGLSVDVQSRITDRATSGSMPTPSTGEVDRELAVAARNGSNLSQNAA